MLGANWRKHMEGGSYYPIRIINFSFHSLFYKTSYCKFNGNRKTHTHTHIYERNMFENDKSDRWAMDMVRL